MKDEFDGRRASLAGCTLMLRTARRLFKRAGLRPEGNAFRLELDGRPLRTPAGKVLVMPTAALAAAVANEWLCQGETLRPETMPLTRLAVTAVDRVGDRRPPLIEALVAYGASDSLCYRAEAPDDLILRQAKTWQPLIDWAADRWGAKLQTGVGVVPIEQPEPAIRALRRVVASADDLELTTLSSAVQASGSLLIGLALLHRRLDAEGAASAALLDESYQAERWGIDPQAEERRVAIVEDLRAAETFMALARPLSQAAGSVAQAPGRLQSFAPSQLLGDA